MSLDKSVVETLEDHEERIDELEQNGGGGGGSPFKMSYDRWDFSPGLSSNVDTDHGGIDVYWGWREFSAIPWRDEDPDWVSNDPCHVVFVTSFSFTPESPGETVAVFEIPYGTYNNAGMPYGVVDDDPRPLAAEAIDEDSVILPASVAYYRDYNSGMILLRVKVDAATAGRWVKVSINTQFITEPQAP